MRFKLDEKWVVIDFTKRKIIDAMILALKTKVSAFNQSNEQHSYPDIYSGIERPRDKFHAKLAGYAEVVTGEWLSKEFYFAPLDRDLDYPSWILCDEYRNYLFEKLREQGKNSNDTEAESIKSRYVLVCEIMIRVAIVALSREENGKRDGEELINALEEFCKIIQRKGYLNNHDWLTPFSKFFATQHPYWLKCLRDASSVIKSIHSNKRAISNTLDYLINLKYQIMRQIVVFSGSSKLTVDDLSDNWISGTFQRTEASMLGNGNQIQQTDSSLSAWSTTSTRQNKIIQSSKNPQRLEQLYKLLNDTNLLTSISIQIDMLMNETGWVLILLGAFKPGILSEMIYLHHKKCTELLTIAEDDPIFNQVAAQGLAKYQATSICNLDIIAQESCSNLVQLEEPNTLNRMVKLISGSLNALIGIQDKLDCQFIDKHLLKNIAPNLVSTNQHGEDENTIEPEKTPLSMRLFST